MNSWILVITILMPTARSEGVTSADTTMFEIQPRSQKRFLLTDCRSTGLNDLNCRCLDLKRDCQKSDTDTCKNCHCLDGNATTFYVKKTYGALCLGKNSLIKAAGFGQPILLYNPPGKVCAGVNKSSQDRFIYSSNNCSFTNQSQVWFWTPGNLLMNALKLKCLEVEERVKDYRSLLLSSCSSSVYTQKLRCNDKFWLGVSSQEGLPNLTHAVNYYVRRSNLNVISLKKRANEGNTWTLYPGNNESICAARSQEGVFRPHDNNKDILQINLLPKCQKPSYGCSDRIRLTTSCNVCKLSDCRILWDESIVSRLYQSTESFTLENYEDEIYIKWNSAPYSSLTGVKINTTIECLSKNGKFREFSLPLQIKNISRRSVAECYQFTQKNRLSNKKNITLLNLSEDCPSPGCSLQVDAPLKLDKTQASCIISWNESTVTRNGGSLTLTGLQRTTEVFSLEKDDKQSFHLQWKSIQNQLLLQGTLFDLTILCYDDSNNSYSILEKSCLVFQIDKRTVVKEMSTGESSKLEIIIPVTCFVVLLLLLLPIGWFYYRKHRNRDALKTSQSKDHLQADVNGHYVNPGEDFATNFPDAENGIKESENPCYESSGPRPNPSVTIGRNKLYEYTEPHQPQRPISDVYEKPLQSRQLSRKVFEDQTDKPRSKPPRTPPRNPKDYEKSNGVEVYTLEPLHTGNDTGECYDQPLSFIPKNGESDEGDTNGKDQLPLSGEYNRVSTPYIKPLPLSPELENTDVYDYATREDMVRELPNPNFCPAEKPLDMTPEKDIPNVASSNTPCSGSTHDSPLYEVLNDQVTHKTC